MTLLKQGLTADKALIRLQRYGKCVGSGVDFFAIPVSQEAIDLCGLCPILEECREYAITYEDYGFWAGTTEAQRLIRRRERGYVRKNRPTREPI